MNYSLQEELVEGLSLIKTQKVDIIYSKSYNHYTTCLKISHAYAILKILGCLLCITLNENSFQLKLWLNALGILSMFQWFHIYRIKNVSNKLDTFLLIADKLSHSKIIISERRQQQEEPERVQDTVESYTCQVYDFTSEQNNQLREDEEKVVKSLATEIKRQIQKIDVSMYYIGKIIFFFYQIIHFYGLYLYNTLYIDSLSFKYMVSILFISTYQYIQFYVFIVIIIVVVPCMLIFNIYKIIRDRKKSYDALQNLKESDYNANLKGDHQCKICMIEYKENDKIIILECCQLHHFHSDCIRDWVKIKTTCPLCRESINSYN